MSAAWPRLCLAILLAAPAPAQQPPNADEATGSIEGTVLDSVTGEPIRKAEVDLNGAAGQGGTQTDLRAGTDTSGHFAFRALPAGSYWMQAQRQGYGPPSGAPAQVALQSGEQKSGIEIRISPHGAISGKVVDESGAPVANCFVSALRPHSRGGRRGLMSRSGVAANDRGEYWLQGLERGRYYVSVRCNGELEAPHPLMPARDPRRPTLVYAPQFYPGVPDTNGATRLSITPGTETQGIDFQVHRVSGVTLRVRVDVADPSVLQNGNIQVLLLPPSLDRFDIGMGTVGGDLDRRTGEFRIRSVIPGSYVLIASTFGNGPVYQARLPVQIGATAPDPIHVTLAPAAEMSGTLEVEGDNPPALDGLSVALSPLSNLPFPRPPQARVGKDGTFTLTGVTTGRWRLIVSGGPYVKALTIGARDASPYGFDLAPGTAGPIRVLASTKTGQVQAAVSAAAGGQAINFLLVPADPERLDSGLVRTSSAGSGHTTLYGVVPGRYRLFAFDAPHSGNLQELTEVLGALEAHAQLVEVGEGQTVQATAEPIEADQLKEALEEAQ